MGQDCILRPIFNRLAANGHTAQRAIGAQDSILPHLGASSLGQSFLDEHLVDLFEFQEDKEVFLYAI